MNAVEVEGLKKSSGEKLVLDDISMVVHHGGIYGFLGPNVNGPAGLIRSIELTISQTTRLMEDKVTIRQKPAG